MNEIALKSLDHDLKKIAKEAGITFSGCLFGTGLKYICIVVIARHIGTLGFGIYALGLTILNFAAVVSVAGLHYGVLRYVSLGYSGREKGKIKGTIVSALELSLFASIVIGVLLFLGSDFIASRIFMKRELGTIIRWFSLALPFLAAIEISVFSIQAVQTLKYKVLVKDIFQQIFNLAIVIFLFTIGLRITGALYAYIISAFISALLGMYYLIGIFPDLMRREVKFVPEFSTLLRFSVPVLGMNILGFLMMWTDILMLGYFLTTRHVGIYNAAAKSAILIAGILVSFNAIFAPMISDLYNRGEMDKLERLLKTVTKWIFTASFAVFLLMVILSKQIMLLFGSEFLLGLPCFLILAFSQMINCAAGPVGSVLVMSGKQDIVLVDTAISSGLNIILNYILIEKYGIVGAALATGFSVVFWNSAFFVQVYYFHRIHPYNLKFVKPVFSGIAAGVVSFGLGHMVRMGNHVTVSLFVIIVFILCYTVMLYVLGFDEEDRVVFKAIYRKVPPIVRKS